MEVTRTITEDDFGRKSTPEKWKSYKIRPSARAILFDNTGRIALIHVRNHKYYKLPGGGLENGESLEEALKRELKEEVGATDIQIIQEVGQIIEYRDEWGMKTENYCFTAVLTSEISDTSRTSHEVDYGHETIWVDDIDQAIELIESGQPKEYGQGFEKLRELTFAKEVKNLIEFR